MSQQTTTILDLPNLPDVPALTLRTWRGEPDLPAMRDVLVEAEAADGSERALTVEDMRISYEHLDNCDLDRDIILAEIDGRAVAYGRCFWGFEPTADRYVYYHYLWLLPSVRSTGLDAAMLGYFEERLRDHAAGHPDDKPKVLLAYALDQQSDRHALLEAKGFQVVTYSQLMSRPLSEPIPQYPLPDGLIMRKMRPDEYERVLRITQKNFSGHRGYQDLTDNDVDEWMNERTYQPELWMLAWDGDLPVGCVGNFIDEEENRAFNRRRGWTEYISTHKDYRGRGIASALITESMHMFREMGMEEVALGVHTENPTGALRLYESLGYRKYSGSRDYEKPLT